MARRDVSAGAAPGEPDPPGERLDLALVGLGRMGRTHLRALEQTRRVRAVAAVDPSASSRARARASGLRDHASVAELLAGKPVDAALVAAPTPRHLATVAALLRAGVPVLCEKPLGLTRADAEAAGALAEETGTPLVVGYWRRFVPSLGALRERIRAGELGEIQLLACWQWDAEPPPAAFRSASGGIAVDMGVHELDQIRWLTGQDVLPVGTVAPDLASAPVVDGDPESLAVLGRLSGGGAAFISLGRRFPRPDSCWVEVWGTRGHAREPFVWGAEGDAVFVRALAAQLDAFADGLRSGTQRGASPADAAAALAFATRLGGA